MKAAFELLVVGFLFSLELMCCVCGVSDWGESCNFTAECSDHRMVCIPDSSNSSKCDCDRFHKWQGSTKGCVLTYDLTTILNMTVTSTDNKGILEKTQQHIYFGHKIAGFFVMGVALTCPILVALHCIHMKKKDRTLKTELSQIKDRVENAKMKRQYQKAGELIV